MAWRNVASKNSYPKKNHYVEEQGAIASKAARLVPVIASISADLSAKAECEVSSSCVSGKGNGGYGSVARVLQNLSARTLAISGEAVAGLQNRDTLLDELGVLTTQLQDTLADESKSIWARCSGLRSIDAQIGQTLKRLEEAVPVAMLMAYASELRAGVVIPGNEAASTTINGFLTGYAANLDTVLAGAETTQALNPTFPPRSGAIETLGYVGQYAPIAILTFAIELIFPIVLWVYTLLTLLWGRYRDDPNEGPEHPDPSDFERLTNRPVDQLLPPQKSLPQLPSQHLSRHHNRKKG